MGRPILADDPAFRNCATHFPGASGVGVRSIVSVDVARVSDSCGYGVPVFEFKGHRPTLTQWATRKGPEAIRSYWREKNASSIEGYEGIPAPR